MSRCALVISLTLTSLTVVAGLGCTTAPLRAIGEQCDLNSDCEAPLVCSLGRCRRQCATIRDCAIGEICVPDNRDIGVCLLPDEVSCERSSQCPAPLVCRAARCGNECSSDRECLAGAMCAEDGVCVDPSGMPCARDSNCMAPLVCGDDGRCRAECAEDRDCPEGRRCDGIRCVPIPPPPLDAGMDSGGGEDAAVQTDCVDAMDCSAPFVESFRCEAGACVIVSCQSGRNDCDGEVATGCESDPASDRLNCAACGTSCGAGGVCNAGDCEGAMVGLDVAQNLCVVWDSGIVTCAGGNSRGQLGRGTVGDRTGVAAPVLDLFDAVAVESGGQTLCALRATGELACWGKGDQGEIGEGRYTTRHRPRPVSGLMGVEEVGVGSSHACARTRSDVYCWGYNSEGELGIGDRDRRNVPTAVGISDAVSLAVGGRTSCVAHTSGAVSCWGSDDEGQLGNDLPLGDAQVPTIVPGLSDIIDIAISQFHVCAVTRTGTVYCWGLAAYGAAGVDPLLGRRVLTPTLVAGLTDAVQIDLGVYLSCARRSGGQVACWGRNNRGGLGSGVGTPDSFVPVEAVGITDAVHVDVGSENACALTAAGHPLCWGSNTNLHFGDTVSTSFVPQPLPDYP